MAMLNSQRVNPIFLGELSILVSHRTDLPVNQPILTDGELCLHQQSWSEKLGTRHGVCPRLGVKSHPQKGKILGMLHGGMMGMIGETSKNVVFAQGIQPPTADHS